MCWGWLSSSLGMLPKRRRLGAAGSGWGYAWAFNQLTWWDYNAYFWAPPPLESCNWVDVQSGDSDIKHQKDALPSFWPCPDSAWWCAALWGGRRSARKHTSQECFSGQMKHRDSYLSHCFLSLSPSLLICLSSSLWCRSNCSLFPTPLPQHCCCCCCW